MHVFLESSQKPTHQHGQRRHLGFVVMALIAFFSAVTYGQVNTGTIVGTVHDPSGAVVPGAAVQVRNVATNVSMHLVTNAAGGYQVPQLIPGTYDVKVTHTGFSTAVRENVVVQVQGRVEVDFTLRPGTVQQEVRVSAAAAVLQTQSAQQGGVIPTHAINDLPLNGRDYDQLVLRVPGTFHMPQSMVANPAEGVFTSNGNLPFQNNFMLDGIDNNSGSENLQEQSAQAIIPSPDALQEFNIQTRTYSVEFGASAGAVVNVSTKSGTNHFHGDLYDYIENNAFDANTWFNNYGGVPKGHFEQNQFGATIGGPIVRNHAFFFLSYETLLSTTAHTSLSTVPIEAMRNGDFSSVAAIHPLTALAANQVGCITNNIIAQNCIDPVGQAIMNLYPLPSPQLGNVDTFTGAPNYEYQTAVPTDTRTFDGRIDDNLTRSDQLFGRYAIDISDYQSPMWTSNPIVGNSEFSTQYILHDQSLALGWTHTLSSSTLNTAHFGFLREFSLSNPIGLKLGTSYAPTVGLKGIPVSAKSGGLPPFYDFGITNIGSSIYRPQDQIAQTWEFSDNFFTLIGKHSLQFGYKFEQNSLNFFDIEAPQTYGMAEGIYSNTPGFGVADFLMGDIAQAMYETALDVHNYAPSNAFYAQDTWRITPALTVNYGLRYTTSPPFWLERTDETSNFSPANGGEVLAVPGKGGWYGRTLIHPTHTNFSPRLGFAYHSNKPIVWRGGFGVFRQFINRIGSESMLQLNPPFLHDVLLNQNFGSTTPVYQLQDGFPLQEALNTATNLTSLQIRAQGSNNRTPYVIQASFGPQIQITNNTLLNVFWVGNWARKANMLVDANQGKVIGFQGSEPLVQFPYPNLSSTPTLPNGVFLNGSGSHSFLEEAINEGNTNYNAFEAELHRNLSHGLMYMLSYTWAHDMANYVDNLTSGGNATRPQNLYDLGAMMSNAPEDVRNSFTATATWALPIGPGGLVLNNNGLASRIIGGWQANALVTLTGGIPFSVTAASESATSGNTPEYPNLVGNPHTGTTRDAAKFAGSHAPGTYLNLSAFAQPGRGTFGDMRPFMYHGPGVNETDLSVFKSFPLGGSRSFQFRTEFFNAFNHPSFDNPGANINNPGSFGKSTGTSTNARVIQFVGKLFF